MMMMMMMIDATFVDMVDKMGQVASKGNEMKSKMKQPSDIPMPRFELGW